ncbi:MAG: histidine phosphatase family protein [Propionibacteriaceae bacterium]|nr:histidine phosphatase family protein [Propionibacteriaceae bacterium]
MTTQQLTLVRHGEIAQNRTHTLETHVPGPPLTARGQQQAQELSMRLAPLDIDAVYASTMLRTQQTAVPLAKRMGVPIEVLEGVHEISSGSLHGRDDHEARSHYWNVVHAWGAGHPVGSLPSGETGSDFFSRFNSSIQEVLAAGHRHPVIVSHQAAIQIWVRSVTGLSRGWMREYPLANTGLVTLGKSVSGWRVIEWQHHVRALGEHSSTG